MTIMRGLARLLQREGVAFNTSFYSRWFPYSPVVGDLEAQPLGVPSFRAGVDLKASMIASVTPYTVANGQRRDFLPPILYQPDPTEARLTTLHKAIQSTVYHGEIVAPVTSWTEEGFPQSLMIVDPQYASLAPGGLTWRIGDLVLGRSEVMHLVRFGLANYQRGIGTVELNRSFFQGVEAQERFQRDFYLHGGIPSIMVKMEPGSSPDDVEEARATWNARLAKREPVFVPGGLGAEAFQLSNEDQQYLQGKAHTLIEISNIVGLPAHYIGAANAPGTYQNIQDARRELVDVYLRPDFRLLEWGFSRLLADGLQVRFDTDELLDTDPLAVVALRKERMAWRTVNETRADDGLPPIPGGDVLASHYAPPGASAPVAPDRAAGAPALSVVPGGDAA